MSIAFSPKGDMVASGGADNAVRLWTGDTLRPIDSLKSPTGQGHTAPVTAVAFTPDGARIASASNDRTVALWDVASKRRIGDPMIGHQGLVLTVAFIANGNEVVSGGNEHTLRLWNGVVGQPLSLPLIGHSGPGHQCCCEPRRKTDRLRGCGRHHRGVERRHRCTSGECARPQRRDHPCRLRRHGRHDRLRERRWKAPVVELENRNPHGVASRPSDIGDRPQPRRKSVAIGRH